MARFIDTLRRHAREVAALEGGQATEFLRLLRGLQDELRGRLYGEHGEQEAPLDAFRLRRILLETESGIRAIEARASAQFKGALDEAVDLATEHVTDEVKTLSGAFDAAPLMVSIDAAKVWADPAHLLLANHFETSVARYGGELLNQIRQRLFVGLRSATPTRDIIRSVAAKDGPLGAVGQSKAETIVRTEVSQAYGVAQHASLDDAAKKIPGGLQKMWLHVGSYRCDTCMPLHGTTRPLDGTWTIVVAKGPPKKVKQIANPPGHPRCVCRISAMKPGWKSALSRLGYLPTQDPDAPLPRKGSKAAALTVE